MLFFKVYISLDNDLYLSINCCVFEADFTEESFTNSEFNSFNSLDVITKLSHSFVNPPIKAVIPKLNPALKATCNPIAATFVAINFPVVNANFPFKANKFLSIPLALIPAVFIWIEYSLSEFICFNRLLD